MPEIAIEKEPTLDVLMGKTPPALSSVNDFPVVETTPDVSVPPDGEAEAEASAAPGPEDEGDAGKTDNSETATESTDEVPGEPDGQKKQSRGVQKKLDELRREAEEARRAAEAEREEKRRLMALLEKRSDSQEEVAGQPEAQDAAPERPNRADFPDDDEWDAALLEYADVKAEWSARQTVRQEVERQRQENERKAIADAQARVREQYQSRVQSAIEKHDDYKQVAESPDVIVSIPMAHAILHAEDGPEVQYYLGSNPAEAKRISQLPPPLQLVELGKISAKLAAPAPAEPKTPPVSVSKAPAPIRPLKGGESSPVVKDPSNMSMDEYVAARKAGQVR